MKRNRSTILFDLLEMNAIGLFHTEIRIFIKFSLLDNYLWNSHEFKNFKFIIRSIILKSRDHFEDKEDQVNEETSFQRRSKVKCEIFHTCALYPRWWYPSRDRNVTRGKINKVSRPHWSNVYFLTRPVGNDCRRVHTCRMMKRLFFLRASLLPSFRDQPRLLLSIWKTRFLYREFEERNRSLKSSNIFHGIFSNPKSRT